MFWESARKKSLCTNGSALHEQASAGRSSREKTLEITQFGIIHQLRDLWRFLKFECFLDLCGYVLGLVNKSTFNAHFGRDTR